MGQRFLGPRACEAKLGAHDIGQVHEQLDEKLLLVREEVSLRGRSHEAEMQRLQG